VLEGMGATRRDEAKRGAATGGAGGGATRREATREVRRAGNGLNASGKDRPLT
jgi:hypothetical protein